MGIRELARALGVSPALVSRLVQKGMPRDEQGARAWRLQYVGRRKEVAPPVVVPIEIRGGEKVQNLDATLKRLRQQERTIAVALEALLKEGRLAEAASLRREHVGTVKALFDAESRSLKINEARGRLISVDRALAMISEAKAEALLLLRRLPELGQSPEEKQRLETFLAAVLNAIRDGAEASLRRTALPK